jgi:hypothetical protein
MYSAKRLASGAFKTCLIGTTCTALPGGRPARRLHPPTARARRQSAPKGSRRGWARQQGLTLVHFSAQLKHFPWDRGCV